ncbi:hypothetical protein [Streptomyces sp. OUCMDZ-3434]|uniref:hypothetical protein n=1 Tax=Streptomyces sp. OUCMDZ-3434 TaxID=1535304 RepID=UPI001E54D8A6|nr:hypothetical protein [Streptomyces sp. OUCMDZ-3434]
MTEPRPADCTSRCIACMTDESHDPIPAPLSPCRRIDRHNSHLHEVYRRPFLCPGVTERAEKETARHGAARAAILREAADHLDRLGLRDLATRELRRMADEAETGGAR